MECARARAMFEARETSEMEGVCVRRGKGRGSLNDLRSCGVVSGVLCTYQGFLGLLLSLRGLVSSYMQIREEQLISVREPSSEEVWWNVDKNILFSDDDSKLSLDNDGLS